MQPSQLRSLTTESRNPNTMGISQADPLEILQMSVQDLLAPAAIQVNIQPDPRSVQHIQQLAQRLPIPTAAELLARPRHPYTRALQKSIPALQPKGAELFTIPGMPPDLSQPIAGCAFAPRCEFARDRCRTDEPLYRPSSDRLPHQPGTHE